jgi:hypothetical protein
MRNEHYQERREKKADKEIEEARELFRQLQPSVNMAMNKHFANQSSPFPDSRPIISSYLDQTLYL